jgi:hypothetical protein
LNDNDLSSDEERYSGDKVRESSTKKHSAVTTRRAAFVGIQERGQVLELDLPQVPGQNSERSTRAVTWYRRDSQSGMGIRMTKWGLMLRLRQGQIGREGGPRRKG